MTNLVRGLGARPPHSSARWPLIVALLTIGAVFVGAAWTRSERLNAISGWKARWPLRASSIEGLLWPTRMRNVAFDVSPNLSVAVARVELGILPWQRVSQAHGVVLRSRGPLDRFWEEARRFSVPRDIEVMDARFEYTMPSRSPFTGDDVSLEAGARDDHVHIQSLQAFGTTFRDVHLWASRPSTAPEIRIAREAEDLKAPRLAITRSPGEGVEWALDIPSQPLRKWAHRVGLTIGESWGDAVFVGVGSLIVPDSPALRPRAEFRFTVDNWHLPNWPEARLLTGRSGAVALRISPGPDTTHAITRVEVAAGLFSLVGQGHLSFGAPNRLTFDAQGELSCASLLANLPESDYRERVHAYLREQREGSASATHVRLALSVRAEAPSALPLKFRWHLHAGCGLPELIED